MQVISKIFPSLPKFYFFPRNGNDQDTEFKIYFQTFNRLSMPWKPMSITDQTMYSRKISVKSISNCVLQTKFLNYAIVKLRKHTINTYSFVSNKDPLNREKWLTLIVMDFMHTRSNDKYPGQLLQNHFIVRQHLGLLRNDSQVDAYSHFISFLLSQMIRPASICRRCCYFSLFKEDNVYICVLCQMLCIFEALNKQCQIEEDSAYHAAM